MTSQHGADALRAGLARLYARMRMHTPTRPGNHMHAQACTHTNMQYLLLFHSNNGLMNAPQCYVTRTLPVLLSLSVTSVPTHYWLVLRVF